MFRKYFTLSLLAILVVNYAQAQTIDFSDCSQADKDSVEWFMPPKGLENGAYGPKTEMQQRWDEWNIWNKRSALVNKNFEIYGDYLGDRLTDKDRWKTLGICGAKKIFSNAKNGEDLVLGMVTMGAFAVLDYYTLGFGGQIIGSLFPSGGENSQANLILQMFDQLKAEISKMFVEERQTSLFQNILTFYSDLADYKAGYEYMPEYRWYDLRDQLVYILNSAIWGGTDGPLLGEAYQREEFRNSRHILAPIYIHLLQQVLVLNMYNEDLGLNTKIVVGANSSWLTVLERMIYFSSVYYGTHERWIEEKIPYEENPSGGSRSKKVTEFTVDVNYKDDSSIEEVFGLSREELSQFLVDFSRNYEGYIEGLDVRDYRFCAIVEDAVIDKNSWIEEEAPNLIDFGGIEVFKHSERICADQMSDAQEAYKDFGIGYSIHGPELPQIISYSDTRSQLDRLILANEVKKLYNELDLKVEPNTYFADLAKLRNDPEYVWANFIDEVTERKEKEEENAKVATQLIPIIGLILN